jgi:hypothetical protein
LFNDDASVLVFSSRANNLGDISDESDDDDDGNSGDDVNYDDNIVVRSNGADVCCITCRFSIAES